MDDTKCSKTLITPATTPGSLEDNEELSLVPSLLSRSLSPPNKVPWYIRYPPPVAILTISLLQLIIFSLATKDVRQSLRYDPSNQLEIWRFVTYMFLHSSVFHAALNVIIQCLFAVMLEKHQGSLRVGVLYFGGGATGALGASCVRYDLVEGASAGVYALLISHLSHILMNSESTKHKLWGCISVTIIVFSDIIYNLIHARTKEDPIISEGAHIAGAISGFLLGMLLYKSEDKEAKIRNRTVFWITFVLFLILIFTLLFLNMKLKRCVSRNLRRFEYSYLC